MEVALSGNIFFQNLAAYYTSLLGLSCCIQLSITDDEALSVVGNSYSVIPQNLMYKKGTNKIREEIIQELLSNDPRSKNQVWTLEAKKKKRRPTPRCRACKTIQNENKFTVTVKGLYVPYEQNFVTETMFYFSPKQQCINNIPHWTNLKPPDRIRADSSFTDVTIAALKDNVKIWFINGVPNRCTVVNLHYQLR